MNAIDITELRQHLPDCLKQVRNRNAHKHKHSRVETLGDIARPNDYRRHSCTVRQRLDDLRPIDVLNKAKRIVRE